MPGASVSSVRPWYNTRGTGMPFKKYPGTGTGKTFVYLPGTSLGSVRLPYSTQNFSEFCNTWIPVPGTSVNSVRHSYPYPKHLLVLQSRQSTSTSPRDSANDSPVPVLLGVLSPKGTWAAKITEPHQSSGSQATWAGSQGTWGPGRTEFRQSPGYLGP